MSIAKLSLVGLLVVTATTATADGFYAGGGLAYYSSTSEGPFSSADPDPAESEDNYAAIGATVGYRMDNAGFFYGGEVDLDFMLDTDFEVGGFVCSDGAAAPYYCEHNYTARFRGIVGAEIAPGFEGFATLGLAVMSGEGAIAPLEVDTGVNTGLTVGAGVQADVGAGKARFEVNYDQLDNTSTKPTAGASEYEPTLESMSLKATYLFSF